MDLTQLRYPVAVWTGRPPLHQIRTLALAFPQQTLSGALSPSQPTAAQPASHATGLLAPEPSRPGRAALLDGKHGTPMVTPPRQASPAAAVEVPLICAGTHPPHAFLVSGAQSGELAHWYVPSYRSAAGAERKACGSQYPTPRALMLRQGAAACTALCYCRDGLTQMFCAGTSEGFLTLWSVGGAKCIRSELVLPFAPNQILFYQRYNPMAHLKPSSAASAAASSSSSSAALGATPSRAGSPPPASGSSTSASSSGAASSSAVASVPRVPSRLAAGNMHNYLLCCSEDSRDVYVVELPSLTLLCLLQHRAPVLGMALVPPSAGAKRAPLLVTITLHHHVCLWDLSGVERKHEELRKARAAAGSRGSAGGGGVGAGRNAAQNSASNSSNSQSGFNLSMSPTTGITTAEVAQYPPQQGLLPNSLSHPTSSLASNSASIIAPSSSSSASSGGSSSAAAASSSASTGSSSGGLVVRWDEPTQAFMLPLPPFSFALSPLFVPVALCLSPQGDRAIVVFPYAFMSLSMRTLEAEGGSGNNGGVVPMALHLGASSEDSAASGHRGSWDDQDISCITRHAPWSGAGFLSVPQSSSTFSADKGHAGDAPQQLLVLWNSSGELVWIYAVTTTSSESGSSSSEAAGVPPRAPVAFAPQRTMSSDAEAVQSSSHHGHSDSAAPSMAHGLTRSNSSSTVRSHHHASYSVSTVSSGGNSSSGQASLPPSSSTSGTAGTPRFTLVGRCVMRAPATSAPASTRASAPEESVTGADEDEFKLHRPSSPSAILASPPPPPPQLGPVAVHLSGHTIYLGTDQGEIYSWHVPLCDKPDLFAHAARGQEEVLTFVPSHVSAVSDGFPMKEAVKPSVTGGHDQHAPPLLRANTTPAALVGASADVASPSSRPSRGLGHSPEDLPTCACMLLDPWHEALLMAVGHASGSVRIWNVLSKASGSLELPTRHVGPVTAVLNLTSAGQPFFSALGDSCVLASAGLDGLIVLAEMSTGATIMTLSCSGVPILSLHKPSSTPEDQLGSFYRGANAALLFACCADRSLRCFSLQTCEVLFVAHGLDGHVRALYRPAWAIASDVVLVLTTKGSVLAISMSTGTIEVEVGLQDGASAFLQRHDLVAPASQLAILAHRLFQMKHLRGRRGVGMLPAAVVPAPAQPSSSSGPGQNPSPSLSRSSSSSGLRSQLFTADERNASATEAAMKLQVDDGHFSGTSALNTTATPTPAAPGAASSYEATPPPLSRARSSMSPGLRGGFLNRSPAPSGAAAAAAAMRRSHPFPLLRQKSVGAALVDPSFQRSVYRLNQAHQAFERDEDERRGAGSTSASSASGGQNPGAGFSSLNPSQPPGQRPVSNIISPPNAPGGGVSAAQAHIAAAGGPLKAVYTAAAAPPVQQQAALAPSMGGGQASSPSPPPQVVGGAPVPRSPISAIDVVTSSTGCSFSPLSHLHATVYMVNVHSLLPFLTAHAGALLTMHKRSLAIAASRDNPMDATLQAAANAAKAQTFPPAFYVLSGLLSTLFDWDSHAPIEATLKGEVRCYPPSPPTAFASLSDNSQALTILLPTMNRDHARWGFDAELTARHSLCLTTVVSFLLEKSDPKSVAPTWFAPVLDHYHSVLPRAFRLFAEPDVAVLAAFALNVHRPVHLAARMLMNQTLERMNPVTRLQLAEEKGRLYDYALPTQRALFQAEFSLTPEQLVVSGSVQNVCENGPGIGFVSDHEMRTAAILTWIGLLEMKLARRAAVLSPGGRPRSTQPSPAPNSSGLGPSATPPLPGQSPQLVPKSEGLQEFEAKAQYLTNTLLRMIAWPATNELEVVKCALACDLLAKGLLVFRHHITEPLLLLRRLFALSQQPHETLSRAAMHALLDSGKIAPTHFITCVGKEALSYRSSAVSRFNALILIPSLIKKYPLALARSLPAAVRMIVSTLDPSEPTLRNTLLQGSTSCLYALAYKYPSVSFHQATQRFAVGTLSGAQSVILVYDLRTATKWRILGGGGGGHTGDIHAVSFHPKGLSLASYSATESPPSVRVWSTGGGGFLSSLLGIEGKCTHSWPMLPCARPAPTAPVAAVENTLRKKPSARPRSTQPSELAPENSSPPEALMRDPDDKTDSDSSDVEDAGAALEVDEPQGSDEDQEGRASPQSLAPKPQPISRSPPARFSLEELQSVKIMWVTERSLKLKREDGSFLDFHLG